MISDKIVVVDDDHKVSQAIRMIFPEYEIIEFRDPHKAIEYIKKPNELNLVLLDVYMGEINGLDILNEIKKNKKDIAVVIMTAFGSKDVVLEALRGHADDFVEKPFDVVELRDKVKSILREKSYFHGIDRNNNIQRIKRFIERNSGNVSLESIASEMCLSPKYVSRLFSGGSEQGFRDYKLKMKIEKAKSLLESSSFTVTQIGMMLGYQNPESFMRIFKKISGVTPSNYRKEFQRHSYGKPLKKRSS